ncbi:hypothetical protein HN588_11140 [Candidatus Bathyarchaeota archaeon]|jgi:hypothetical protein|nr:hypothetical protein [Candidatus Bathyarchaeota archaeon]
MASLKDSKTSISAMKPDVAMAHIMEIRQRRRTYSSRQAEKKKTTAASKKLAKLSLEDLRSVINQLEA